MGCSSSSPSGDTGNYKRRGNQLTNDPVAARSQSGVSMDFDTVNMVYFDEILTSTNTIAVPNNMAPVVCFSKSSFPIFLAHMPMKNSFQSSCRLPAAAAYVANRSRIICFPQISYFESKIYKHQDTRQFIFNAISFISGSAKNNQKGLALCFSSDINAKITKFFSKYQFNIEFANSLPSDLSEFKFLMIPSSFNLNAYAESVNNFLNNGNGIAVFFDPSQNSDLFIVNDYISKCGLSYVPISVDFETKFLSTTTTNDFQSLCENSLIRIIQRFKNATRQHINYDSSFRDKIDVLKFHMLACGVYNPSEVHSCYRSCYRYLERTKFKKGSSYCQTDVQRCIAELMLCITENIDPHKCLMLPDIDEFPGTIEQSETSSFEITIDVKKKSWSTTGLWALPGICMEIEFKNDDWENVIIQVGSHTEDFLQTDIPWPRWPVVYRTVQAQKKLSLTSPTGGIIYLYLNEGEKSKSVSVSFTNVIQYPHAILDQPTIWDETCFSMAPWCEFDCGNIVFTLPTTKSREADTDWLLTQYCKLVTSIWDYFEVPDEERIKYRVVFDIALSGEGPTLGYPIVLLTSSASNIIQKVSKPNSDIFTLTSLLVLSNINEGAFSPPIETAVSALIAEKILSQHFESVEHFTFDDKDVSSIYNSLCELQMDSEELHKALKAGCMEENGNGDVVIAKLMGIGPGNEEEDNGEDSPETA